MKAVEGVKLKITDKQKTNNMTILGRYKMVMTESQMLRKFLNKFDRMHVHGKVVVTKDGNRLGKRKYAKYLKALCRVYDIKIKINSTFGASIPGNTLVNDGYSVPTTLMYNKKLVNSLTETTRAMYPHNKKYHGIVTVVN